MSKLVKCKSCGNEIAKSAKVCPHCGAKVKRKSGCGTVVLAVFILFGIGYLSQFREEAAKHTEEIEQQVLNQRNAEAKLKAEKEAKALAQLTPEQRKEYNVAKKRQAAARRFSAKYRSSWDGSIKPVVAFVKSHLKNPDSFKHVNTNWYIDWDGKEDHYIVEMQYRATNSFGALVTENIKLLVTQDGHILTTKQ